MGRNRGFDETAAVVGAAELFSRHGYEGTSVDDLVRHLGVHRGSLYRTFGGKLDLFRTALRTQVDDQLLPWTETLPPDPDAALASEPPAALQLLLVAMLESAADDPVVGAEVARVLDALERPFGHRGPALSATLLGLALRRRAGLPVRPSTPVPEEH